MEDITGKTQVYLYYIEVEEILQPEYLQVDDTLYAFTNEGLVTSDVDEQNIFGTHQLSTFFIDDKKKNNPDELLKAAKLRLKEIAKEQKELETELAALSDADNTQEDSVDDTELRDITPKKTAQETPPLVTDNDNNARKITITLPRKLTEQEQRSLDKKKLSGITFHYDNNLNQFSAEIPTNIQDANLKRAVAGIIAACRSKGIDLTNENFSYQNFNRPKAKLDEAYVNARVIQQTPTTPAKTPEKKGFLKKLFGKKSADKPKGNKSKITFAQMDEPPSDDNETDPFTAPDIVPKKTTPKTTTPTTTPKKSGGIVQSVKNLFTSRKKSSSDDLQELDTFQDNSQHIVRMKINSNINFKTNVPLIVEGFKITGGDKGIFICTPTRIQNITLHFNPVQKTLTWTGSPDNTKEAANWMHNFIKQIGIPFKDITLVFSENIPVTLQADISNYLTALNPERSATSETEFSGSSLRRSSPRETVSDLEDLRKDLERAQTQAQDFHNKLIIFEKKLNIIPEHLPPNTTLESLTTEENRWLEKNFPDFSRDYYDGTLGILSGLLVSIEELEKKIQRLEEQKQKSRSPSPTFPADQKSFELTVEYLGTAQEKFGDMTRESLNAIAKKYGFSVEQRDRVFTLVHEEKPITITLNQEDGIIRCNFNYTQNSEMTKAIPDTLKLFGDIAASQRLQLSNISKREMDDERIFAYIMTELSRLYPGLVSIPKIEARIPETNEEIKKEISGLIEIIREIGAQAGKTKSDRTFLPRVIEHEKRLHELLLALSESEKSEILNTTQYTKLQAVLPERSTALTPAKNGGPHTMFVYYLIEDPGNPKEITAVCILTSGIPFVEKFRVSNPLTQEDLNQFNAEVKYSPTDKINELTEILHNAAIENFQQALSDKIAKDHRVKIKAEFDKQDYRNIDFDLSKPIQPNTKEDSVFRDMHGQPIPRQKAKKPELPRQIVIAFTAPFLPADNQAEKLQQFQASLAPDYTYAEDNGIETITHTATNSTITIQGDKATIVGTIDSKAALNIVVRYCDALGVLDTEIKIESISDNFSRKEKRNMAIELERLRKEIILPLDFVIRFDRRPDAQLQNAEQEYLASIGFIYNPANQQFEYGNTNISIQGNEIHCSISRNADDADIRSTLTAMFIMGHSLGKNLQLEPAEYLTADERRNVSELYDEIDHNNANLIPSISITFQVLPGPLKVAYPTAADAANGITLVRTTIAYTGGALSERDALRRMLELCRDNNLNPYSITGSIIHPNQRQDRIQALYNEVRREVFPDVEFAIEFTLDAPLDPVNPIPNAVIIGLNAEGFVYNGSNKQFTKAIDEGGQIIIGLDKDGQHIYCKMPHDLTVGNDDNAKANFDFAIENMMRIGYALGHKFRMNQIDRYHLSQPQKDLLKARLTHVIKNTDHPAISMNFTLNSSLTPEQIQQIKVAAHAKQITIDETAVPPEIYYAGTELSETEALRELIIVGTQLSTSIDTLTNVQKNGGNIPRVTQEFTRLRDIYKQDIAKDADIYQKNHPEFEITFSGLTVDDIQQRLAEKDKDGISNANRLRDDRQLGKFGVIFPATVPDPNEPFEKLIFERFDIVLNEDDGFYFVPRANVTSEDVENGINAMVYLCAQLKINPETIQFDETELHKSLRKNAKKVFDKAKETYFPEKTRVAITPKTPMPDFHAKMDARRDEINNALKPLGFVYHPGKPHTLHRKDKPEELTLAIDNNGFMFVHTYNPDDKEKESRQNLIDAVHAAKTMHTAMGLNPKVDFTYAVADFNEEQLLEMRSKTSPNSTLYFNNDAPPRVAFVRVGDKWYKNNSETMVIELDEIPEKPEDYVLDFYRQKSCYIDPTHSIDDIETDTMLALGRPPRLRAGAVENALFRTNLDKYGMREAINKAQAGKSSNDDTGFRLKENSYDLVHNKTSTTMKVLEDGRCMSDFLDYPKDKTQDAVDALLNIFEAQIRMGRVMAERNTKPGETPNLGVTTLFLAVERKPDGKTYSEEEKQNIEQMLKAVNAGVEKILAKPENDIVRRAYTFDAKNPRFFVPGKTTELPLKRKREDEKEEKPEVHMEGTAKRMKK